MQPDSIDQQIIDILREECVPNSTIAKRLGVVEGTIRLRLKKLKDAGILKIRAQIDPEVLSDRQVGIVAVNVSDPSLLDSKAREISELDDVLSASIVSGRYDILIEVLVESNSGLVRFLTEELAKVQGLTTSESFVFLRSYKKFV